MCFHGGQHYSGNPARYRRLEGNLRYARATPPPSLPPLQRGTATELSRTVARVTWSSHSSLTDSYLRLNPKSPLVLTILQGPENGPICLIRRLVSPRSTRKFQIFDSQIVDGGSFQ